MIANPTGIPSRTLGLNLSRDIFKFVKEHKIITPQQCAVLFYKTGVASLRSAQNKLLAMHKTKNKVRRLSRFPSDVRGYYIYHIEKVGEWEHIEGLNWAYIWLGSRLKEGESIVCFDDYPNYGYLRPDAQIGIQGTDGETRYMFIEIDRAQWRNEWDKGPKYAQLFKEQGEPKDFPPILIVTTEESRIDHIKKKMSEHRQLRPMYKLLPEIIKEVMPCRSLHGSS